MVIVEVGKRSRHKARRTPAESAPHTVDVLCSHWLIVAVVGVWCTQYVAVCWLSTHLAPVACMPVVLFPPPPALFSEVLLCNRGCTGFSRLGPGHHDTLGQGIVLSLKVVMPLQAGAASGRASSAVLLIRMTGFAAAVISHHWDLCTSVMWHPPRSWAHGMQPHFHAC